MTTPKITVRIGIYGEDTSGGGARHNCGLWPAGVVAALQHAEAEYVFLDENLESSWAERMDGIHGILILGSDMNPRRFVNEAEALCTWCHNHNIPYLGIDQGLHILNTAHGGTLYMDLPRDLPEALQHRHPPERGLRHAINVLPDTFLATLYGEGEVVVNSEHRKAIQRVARDFRVCAQALDGVIEAIESRTDWYAVGVQWNPASISASGLDIQLFRGLINACIKRMETAKAEQEEVAA